MKKFILQLGISFFLGLIAQFFLPWWSLVIVTALVAIFIGVEKPFWSFLAGFLSMDLLWFGYAYWLSSGEANQVLPTQIGEIFGGLSLMALLIVTAIVGGLMGGLGALSGTLGKRMIS